MNPKESVFASLKAWALVTFKKALPIFRKALPVITYTLPVITFALGIFIDKGIIWQLRNYDLQREKFVYEMKKEQNTLLYSIIQSTERYIEIERGAKKLESQRMTVAKQENRINSEPVRELMIGETTLRNKAHREKIYLDDLKHHYMELETKLASLEGRPPREVHLDFMPLPAPTNLRIVTSSPTPASP